MVLGHPLSFGQGECFALVNTPQGLQGERSWYGDRSSSEIIHGRSVRVEVNRFELLGEGGVRITGNSSAVQVEANLFAGIGSSGIRIGAGEGHRPERCEARANFPEEIGFNSNAPAILVYAGDQIVIAQNHIERSSMNGISLVSIGSTSSEPDPLSLTTDSVVKENEVRRIQLLANDGGGIYLVGNLTPSYLPNLANQGIDNCVYLSYGTAADPQTPGQLKTFYGAFGIYFDNVNSGTLVSGNNVNRVSESCIALNGGIDATITRNLLANGGEAQIRVYDFGPGTLRGNRVTRNVSHWGRGNLRGVSRTWNFVAPLSAEALATAFPEIENNLFSRFVPGESLESRLIVYSAPPLDALFSGLNGGQSLAQWRALFGYDATSETGDPGLMFSGLDPSLPIGLDPSGYASSREIRPPSGGGPPGLLAYARERPDRAACLERVVSLRDPEMESQKSAFSCPCISARVALAALCPAPASLLCCGFDQRLQCLLADLRQALDIQAPFPGRVLAELRQQLGGGPRRKQPIER